jgi:hypothetical protein
MIEKAWLCENLETKVVNEGGTISAPGSFKETELALLQASSAWSSSGFGVAVSVP